MSARIAKIGLVLAALAGLLTASVIGASQVNGDGHTVADKWAGVAAQARSLVEADPDQLDMAHELANAAYGAGLDYGWSDPRTIAYLDALYDTQNADAGYGLGSPWDAFQDGSTNSADTSYTVTVADHVGPALLAGYEAGVVSAAKVSELVDWIHGLPQMPLAGTPSYCWPYSASGHDDDPALCVNNVNAAAMKFLVDAEQAGFGHVYTPWRVMAAAHREAENYHRYLWPYIGSSGRMSDLDHNALDTEVALELWPPVGRIALRYAMTVADDHPTSPLARVRLAPFDCAASAQWVDAVEALLADPPGDDMIRYTQVWRWAARAAHTC